MADLILREPTLRPTAAFKKVMPDWTDSVVHRLMGKWRKQREALLAEARQRQSAREARESTTGAIRAGGSFAHLMEQMRAIQESPALRAAREMANSPTMKAMRAMADSPTMRAMREMQNSPTMRAMREMHNSPTMRAIREMQDSPTMRAIRQLQDSPMMKLMREQERLRRNLGF